MNLSSTASITAREVSETLFNASGFNLNGNTFRVNALMDSEAETERDSYVEKQLHGKINL